MDPVVSAKRIQNVLIHFQKQTKKFYKKQGLAFAWSYPFIGAKTIYVNITFKKRIAILQKLINFEQDTIKEIKTITVYISLLLLHELAHLLLRWNGFNYTPTDFGEAGDNLETALFGSQLAAVFTSNEPWSENSRFICIAIEKLKRDCNEFHYVSFENYIEKIFDLPLYPSDYIRLPFCEKPIEQVLIVLKQSDEEFDNEEDSNQSDIVRRLFNIDINPCGIDYFRSRIKKPCE